MKIEILVYAYLAVCLAMIGFNIACVFLFSRSDRKTERSRKYYVGLISEQFGKEYLDDRHRVLIFNRLQRIQELTAFDLALESLTREHPDEVFTYLRQLEQVFVALADHYSRKNEIQMVYYPYIISRYRLFAGEDLPQIDRILVDLLSKPSVYCRENALNAVYSMDIVQNVVDALRIIDDAGYYHNKKLITDGLMTFRGDTKGLNDCLWRNLDSYSLNIQLAILDYIRFTSGDYQERMLGLLREPRDREIHFCAIRYLGRYPYEPAYEQLLNYVEHEDTAKWEYTSIACFALASYPGERTVSALKKALGSQSWYVRLNASKTLERLGLEYVDLSDIIDGDDRYASEIVRYRFEKKRIHERRKTT